MGKKDEDGDVVMSGASLDEDLKSLVDNLQKLVIQQKDSVVPRRDYSFEKRDLPMIVGSDRQKGRRMPPPHSVAGTGLEPVRKKPPSYSVVDEELEVECSPEIEAAQKRKWRGVITEAIVEGTFLSNDIEAFPCGY